MIKQFLVDFEFLLETILIFWVFFNDLDALTLNLNTLAAYF